MVELAAVLLFPGFGVVIASILLAKLLRREKPIVWGPPEWICMIGIISMSIGGLIMAAHLVLRILLDFGLWR
jgi:general stress protein CsbA